MKVLMVNPNRYRPYVQPVGLEYVCNSLARAAISFELVDLNFESESSLYRKVRDGRFAVIGITIRNIDSATLVLNEFFVPAIRRMIRKIKKHRECCVVLGGAGYSHLPKEILEFTQADFGVVGYGEEALPQLISALQRQGDLSKIDNLVWREKGRIRINALSTNNYSSLPARRRNIARNSAYYRVYKSASIEVKRGCNLSCGYCYEPNIVGHSVITRQIKSIIQEIKELTALGMRNITFCDSEFNLGDRRFAYALCQTIIDEQLNITWSSTFYPERDYPEELLQLMHRSGCLELALSSDSGSNQILKSMEKRYNAEDVVVISEKIKRAGIRLIHYYLIGWPGESLATIDDSVGLINASRPDMSIFFVGIRIAPNTKLARIAEAEGVIPPQANLLTPVFYNSRQVLKEFLPYLRKRTRKIPNCVLPSRWRNFMHVVLHNIYSKGYEGASATIGDHFRALPPKDQLLILINSLADFFLRRDPRLGSASARSRSPQ